MNFLNKDVCTGHFLMFVHAIKCSTLSKGVCLTVTVMYGNVHNKKMTWEGNRRHFLYLSTEGSCVLGPLLFSLLSACVCVLLSTAGSSLSGPVSSTRK